MRAKFKNLNSKKGKQLMSEIEGYRVLNQIEINLVNKIKEKEKEVLALIDEVEEYRIAQYDSWEVSSICTHQELENSGRSLSLATEKLQTGFMWFVRAITMPRS